MTKRLKVFAKLATHLLVVALLTAYFVYLSNLGTIGEQTVVPPAVSKLIDFFVSLRGLWTLPAALAVLLILAVDFSAFKEIRGFFYRSYVVALGFLTGKLYTLGALYFGYAFASDRVSYLQPLENPTVIACCSILLGLSAWFGGKALALKVLRRRSNNSFKPKPLRSGKNMA